MTSTTAGAALALDLEQIKAAALAATQGPWHWANPAHIAAANPAAVLELVARLERAEALLAGAEQPASAPKLAVWYGSMPESNGKSNWTAILHKGDICEGFTIDRSEYPDRVRYEADRVRFLIGELSEAPCILDYDADKCDAAPEPSASPAALADAQREDLRIVGVIADKIQDGSLFHAGLFSRAQLAGFVRRVAALAAPQPTAKALTDERG